MMTDKSIVEQIKHYQRDILKCPDNSKRMIRCIERLNVLPIKIAHLQETGVGKSVNELRKCGGEVGAAANSLVCKWKDMVREDEEEEDSMSEPDEDPRDIDIPQDIKSYSSTNTLKDKCFNRNEESKKILNVSGTRKTETNDVESRSLKSKDYQNSVVSEDRKKEYKSNHDSRSNSKTSSHQNSKNEYSEKSYSKSQTKYVSESERNGMKKDKYDKKHSDSKNNPSTKKSSSDKNKDVKEKNEERRSRNEKSPKKSSTSKYEIKQEESESSEDEAIYKPSNRKRKKSYSSDEDECEKRNKHKTAKMPSNPKSSEESSGDNESDDQDKGSDRNHHSKSSSYSESENDSSTERSCTENLSDKGSESENENSDVKQEDVENNTSKSESESSQEEDSDNSSEKYVPVKIKREKVSPPKQSQSGKSSGKTKHDSSTKSQSSSYKRSSSSSSTMKNYEHNDVKIKKEKVEKDPADNKHRHKTSESDKKDQKSTSKSHKSSSQSKLAEKKVKVKIEKKEDGSIDCESGASFGDALLGLSDSKTKYAKKRPVLEKEKPRSSSSKVSSSERPKSKSDRQDPSSSFSSGKQIKVEPDLLKNTVKLEPLDVDLRSTLPEISPHYKPLPHYSPPCSPASKRSKLLSHEEALSTIMSTKNQRTKVYSGNKIGYVKVPSLFELCTQVLRDNIDALEYTGGVPYDLLKPVLDRATADQLYQLEHYNPYLVQDTDGLWQFHCNKDFRGKKPDEFETWRELYLRCLDEREKKLEALKNNITKSMAKSLPVRKTKLAYVDSVVKPPRNVAKQQMKFGTGKQELVSKAMVGAASSTPAPPVVSVPAPPQPRPNLTNSSFPIPNFLKKKKAPLMAKTLQLMKGSNRFKR